MKFENSYYFHNYTYTVQENPEADTPENQIQWNLQFKCTVIKPSNDQFTFSMETGGGKRSAQQFQFPLEQMNRTASCFSVPAQLDLPSVFPVKLALFVRDRLPEIEVSTHLLGMGTLAGDSAE